MFLESNVDYIKNALIKLKTKRKLVIGITSFLTLLIILLGGWIWELSNYPDKVIYYQETFDESMGKWEGIDAKWQQETKEGQENGSVNLSAKKYLAPHIKYDLSIEESSSDVFVWHFQTRVASFTDKAMTLGALGFSAGPMVIVVDNKGGLGIANNLFDPPVYDSNPMVNFKKDKWQDIYVHVDGVKQKLIFYINDKKVLTQEWKQATFPVQEIWLGAIWLKGGGSYGVPLDVSYDNITLGNEGLLPKPSFLEYMKNIIH